MAIISRKEKRAFRHERLRKRVNGTPERPRMAVFTTDKHLYVQIIDDSCGRTMVSCSTVDKEIKTENVKGNVQGAAVIGRKAAERALAAGVQQVVFDRGGFRFHGRVKAIADSARAAGLKF